MTLQSGARLGPYEIVDLLGKGGMGEVYRARDTRLERDVALKVLPDHTRNDPELRSRFEREARVLSQLEHSHVCRLYDIGEENGSGFLVMELLHGETLRQRLDRGRMGLPEALEIGAQIAEGLDAAHRRGLIHRDLKPGNVILTAEGAKILDFGLAKRFALGDNQETLLAQSGEPVSAQGSIAGTVPYMSPEQLEGQTVDHRSDLFALGAVLYEMVTGRRAFGGDSAASVIAGILDSPPDGLEEIAVEGSQPVQWVLERLLSRAPDERLQSAKDVGLLLRRPNHAASEANGRRKSSVLVGATAAGLLLGAVATAFFFRTSEGSDIDAPRPPERVQLETTGGHWLRNIALSPDGSEFAFSRAIDRDDDVWHLFTQRIGTGAPALVSDHGDPFAPSFSPDGESLAFVSSVGSSDGIAGRVMIANRRDGSTTRLIDDACWPRWSPDGTTLAFLRTSAGLSCDIVDPRITAAGSSDLWLFDVARAEERPLVANRYVAFPTWSPDSKRLAFVSFQTTRGGQMDLWMVDIGTTTVTQLTDDPASEGWPAWNPADGRIYYSSDRGGIFNAWRIDPDRQSESPEPWTLPFGPLAQIAFSETGDLAVFATQRFERSTVRIPLENGLPRVEALTTLLSGDTEYVNPRLSPSGDRIVVQHGIGPRSNILVMSLASGVLTRLTNDSYRNRFPRWIPHGDWVSYYSDRSGSSALWVSRPDGSDDGLLDERYLGSSNHMWSPDGGWLLLMSAERPWRIPVQRAADSGSPPVLGAEEQLPTCPNQTVFWAHAISNDGRIAGNCSGGKVSIYDPQEGTWIQSQHFAGWDFVGWLDNQRLIIVGADIVILDARSLETIARIPTDNQTIAVLGAVTSVDPGGRFFITERTRVTSSLWSAQLEVGSTP